MVWGAFCEERVVVCNKAVDPVLGFEEDDLWLSARTIVLVDVDAVDSWLLRLENCSVIVDEDVDIEKVLIKLVETVVTARADWLLWLEEETKDVLEDEAGTDSKMLEDSRISVLVETISDDTRDEKAGTKDGAPGDCWVSIGLIILVAAEIIEEAVGVTEDAPNE